MSQDQSREGHCPEPWFPYLEENLRPTLVLGASLPGSKTGVCLLMGATLAETMADLLSLPFPSSSSHSHHPVPPGLLISPTPRFSVTSQPSCMSRLGILLLLWEKSPHFPLHVWSQDCLQAPSQEHLILYRHLDRPTRTIRRWLQMVRAERRV